MNSVSGVDCKVSVMSSSMEREQLFKKGRETTSECSRSVMYCESAAANTVICTKHTFAKSMT